MDDCKNLNGSACNRVHYIEFLIYNHSVFFFFSTRHKPKLWIGFWQWWQCSNACHYPFVELFSNFFTKQSCSIHFNRMKIVKKALLDKQLWFHRRLFAYIFSAHHCKCLSLNSSKVILPDLSALLISAWISSSVTSTLGSGKSQLICFVLVVAMVLIFLQKYKLFWIWVFIPLSFSHDAVLAALLWFPFLQDLLSTAQSVFPLAWLQLGAFQPQCGGKCRPYPLAWPHHAT